MDQGKKGEYSWLPHNGSSLPLTFTNWNKHQPGSCFVIMNEHRVIGFCLGFGLMFCLLLFQLIHLLLPLVSAGGCVAMSGGPALGHWEVKDCKSYKALSVCKQSISSYHDVRLPEHHIDAYAPCPPGWESHSGLLHCFKVESHSSLLCAPFSSLS